MRFSLLYHTLLVLVFFFFYYYVDAGRIQTKGRTYIKTCTVPAFMPQFQLAFVLSSHVISNPLRFFFSFSFDRGEERNADEMKDKYLKMRHLSNSSRNFSSCLFTHSSHVVNNLLRLSFFFLSRRKKCQRNDMLDEAHYTNFH